MLYIKFISRFYQSYFYLYFVCIFRHFRSSSSSWQSPLILSVTSSSPSTSCCSWPVPTFGYSTPGKQVPHPCPLSHLVRVYKHACSLLYFFYNLILVYLPKVCLQMPKKIFVRTPFWFYPEYFALKFCLYLISTGKVIFCGYNIYAIVNYYFGGLRLYFKQNRLMILAHFFEALNDWLNRNIDK